MEHPAALTQQELKRIEESITTQPRLSVYHELALSIAQSQLSKALWWATCATMKDADTDLTLGMVDSWG